MQISCAVLQMWKPPTKWKNYLLTMSTDPQASWSLRTDNLNPCDTALLPHHQPITELCTSWQYPVTAPPHLPFKNASSKPFGELETFQGMNHLLSSHGLAINLSLLQTPYLVLLCGNAGLIDQFYGLVTRKSKTRLHVGSVSFTLTFATSTFAFHLLLLL